MFEDKLTWRFLVQTVLTLALLGVYIALVVTNREPPQHLVTLVFSAVSFFFGAIYEAAINRIVASRR